MGSRRIPDSEEWLLFPREKDRMWAAAENIRKLYQFKFVINETRKKIIEIHTA